MIRSSCVLLLICAAPAIAQQNLLARADSLLVAGKYAEARTVLAEWQQANPASASIEPGLRARSLYLSARLTTDADEAQELYLTIALSHPTAREAPDALLRLGQGYSAAGDPRRAVAYLERLVNDYPTAPARSLGYLWLARAQLATGNATRACSTISTALKTQTNTEIKADLQAEERAACSTTSTTDSIPTPGSAPIRVPSRPVVDTPRPAPTPTPTPPPASTNPSVARDSVKPPPSDAAGRYSVQTAAFREVRSANAIAAQLRRAGFDSRVVYVGEGTLARVRIGRFRSQADAAAELRRAKAAGISGIIVDDVVKERTQR
jgi:TolA-binding protein